MGNLIPRAVALGTAGGPRWWAASGAAERAGIATAILVGDSAYLVDCGQGAGQRLAQAAIPLDRIRGVFLTHLHSDHTIGLPELLIFGMMASKAAPAVPIPIIGPGARGVLPAVSPHATVMPRQFFPDDPTPGTTGLVTGVVQSFGTDIIDRTFDSLRPAPLDIFAPQDIVIPDGIGYHPNHEPSPAMEPIEVYRDELVTVTAVLVQHPPIAPAFAFRFDTEEGSITISGDTAPSANLVRLAQGTDLLFHEVIDYDWVQSFYAHEREETRSATIEHHRKSHTSAAQAAEIANASGARGLALHHLVPASTPRETWLAGAASFNGPVFVPDDLDVIDVRTCLVGARAEESRWTSVK